LQPAPFPVRYASTSVQPVFTGNLQATALPFRDASPFCCFCSGICSKIFAFSPSAANPPLLKRSKGIRVQPLDQRMTKGDVDGLSCLAADRVKGGFNSGRCGESSAVRLAVPDADFAPPLDSSGWPCAATMTFSRGIPGR
jgi:hypothetical protein